MLLLHGPNLNLLGDREPEVYGTATLADHVATTERTLEPHGLAVEAFQSNHEGQLVDAIHGARRRCAAIIINPGAFTHYAWSIHDALAAFDGPGRRAAPVEPQRPRAVAPHQRDRAGGEGLDRRLRRRRLPARRRGRRPPPRERRMTVELPPIGYATRPDAVRAQLDGATLLVSNPSNIRWLTSFGGSLGWVVVGPQRCALVTDGRYAERAAADIDAAGLAGIVDVVVGTTRPQIRDHVVAVAGAGPVRAEADHLTHAQWLDLAGALTLATGRRHDHDAAPGQGSRRAGPHGRRRPGSPTPPSPRWPRCSRRAPPRPTSATSSSTSCTAPAPTGRATTRSSPAGPTTRPAPTTTPATARSSRATPSSSTSAPSSTATTPT